MKNRVSGIGMWLCGFIMLTGVVIAESTVNDVQVTEIDNKTRLVLSLDGSAQYETSELQNPKRIILSLKEKAKTKELENIEKSTGLVHSVRFMLLKNAATQQTGICFLDAMVIEIDEDAQYEVFQKDNNIMVDVIPASSSSGVNQEQIEKLLASAEKNYSEGYVLLAKADCQSALQSDPQNEDAQALLKKIDDKIASDRREADQLAEKVAGDETKSLENQKVEAGEIAGALEKQMEASEETEKQYSDLMEDGNSFYKQQRYEEAAEAWRQALRIKPGDEKATSLLEKAREKIRSEQIGPSEVTAGMEPGKTQEIEKLQATGEEQFANLDYANAIITFEKILELDPENLRARRYLARARRNQRTYVEEGGSPEDVILRPSLQTQVEDLGVLSLDDCVTIGVANHLPSKIAQEEVVLARMKVSESKRALFPKVKLKWKETSGTSGTDDREDFKGEEFGAELQQNIYAGGKYRLTYNQARVNLAVARKNYEKTKSEFTFEVTQAFYNMAFAKEKMKNKQELLKRGKELLDIAEKQFNAKALTLAEILEARDQYEEILYQVQEVKNDVEMAKLALIQLLSVPHTTTLDIVNMPAPASFKLDTEKLLDVAYKNRRDYQVKKLLVLFYKYGLEIAEKKSSFNVELSGTYGRHDEYYADEEIDLKDEYYLGIKVSKNLGPHVLEANAIKQDKVPQVGQYTSTEYQSGEVALKLWENPENTSVAEANIAYHKALNEMEDSKRTLVHDIQSSVYSIKEAEAKIKNRKAEILYAEEELRSFRAKQQMDQATIVQVMRAEAKLWNSKTDLISSQADYYISFSRLNKNLGIHNYMDPSSGVVAVDKENLGRGIRLMVSDKQKGKKWYQMLPVGHGVASYYPDEVVTDILREKQEKSVMRAPKKLFGIFGKKSADDESMDQYKVYDEKYHFSTPSDEKKHRWFSFSKKKLDDDFSPYYSEKKEYDRAFDHERPKKTRGSMLKTPEQILAEKSTKEDKDMYQPYLQDKDRITFVEYHVEDNSYETIFAVRTSAAVDYTVTTMKDPYRIIITFKDTVISALPDSGDIREGVLVSFKAFHAAAVLPSMYRNWQKLLSLILEVDKERKYTVSSEPGLFKVTVKK
ncbi:MAG: TolC family protein [Candidatus Aureabacteria bacterium]|nr:TolC family protein [Candidatus Auribacterota bacterium]